MPAASYGKEALRTALGPFKAFGATMLPTARAAPHAGIGWWEAFGDSIAASLAGGRPQVRGEDHVVAVLAGVYKILPSARSLICCRRASPAASQAPMMSAATWVMSVLYPFKVDSTTAIRL